MSKLIKQGIRNVLTFNAFALCWLGFIVLIATLMGYTYTIEHAKTYLYLPLGSVIGTLVGMLVIRLMGRDS